MVGEEVSITSRTTVCLLSLTPTHEVSQSVRSAPTTVYGERLGSI